MIDEVAESYCVNASRKSNVAKWKFDKKLPGKFSFIAAWISLHLLNVMAFLVKINQLSSALFNFFLKKSFEDKTLEREHIIKDLVCLT